MNERQGLGKRLLTLLVLVIGLCLSMSVSAWAYTLGNDISYEKMWEGSTVDWTNLADASSSLYANTTFDDGTAVVKSTDKATLVAAAKTFTVTTTGAGVISIYGYSNDNLKVATLQNESQSVSLSGRKASEYTVAKFSVSSAGEYTFTNTGNTNAAIILVGFNSEGGTVIESKNIFEYEGSAQSNNGTVRVMGKISSANSDSISEVSEVGMCITTAANDAPSANNVYAADEHLGTKTLYMEIVAADGFDGISDDGNYRADFYVTGAASDTILYVYTYTKVGDAYYYSDTATEVVVA